MIIIRIFLFALFSISYVQSQASSASTAGIPASQNVGNGATSTAIPAGLGGSSTGQVVTFTPGATMGPPSSSVIASSLTGAALSEQQASLSMQAAHNSGSDGMYTSTTGGAISGISTGLQGGYDTPAPTSTSASGSNQASTDSASSLGLSSSGLLLWTLSTFACLIGALVVL